MKKATIVFVFLCMTTLWSQERGCVVKDSYELSMNRNGTKGHVELRVDGSLHDDTYRRIFSEGRENDYLPPVLVLSDANGSIVDEVAISFENSNSPIAKTSRVAVGKEDFFVVCLDRDIGMGSHNGECCHIYEIVDGEFRIATFADAKGDERRICLDATLKSYGALFDWDGVPVVLKLSSHPDIEKEDGSFVTVFTVYVHGREDTWEKHEKRFPGLGERDEGFHFHPDIFVRETIGYENIGDGKESKIREVFAPHQEAPPRKVPRNRR